MWYDRLKLITPMRAVAARTTWKGSNYAFFFLTLKLVRVSLWRLWRSAAREWFGLKTIHTSSRMPSSLITSQLPEQFTKTTRWKPFRENKFSQIVHKIRSALVVTVVCLLHSHMHINLWFTSRNGNICLLRSSALGHAWPWQRWRRRRSTHFLGPQLKSTAHYR